MPPKRLQQENTGYRKKNFVSLDQAAGESLYLFLHISRLLQIWQISEFRNTTPLQGLLEQRLKKIETI